MASYHTVCCVSPFPQFYVWYILFRNGKIRLDIQLQEVCGQITHMSQRPEKNAAQQGGKLQERLRLFFPSHWQLNKLIEQTASQFKHKPIGLLIRHGQTYTIATIVVIRCFLACPFVNAGPLAAYVSVKDKRWLVPVQLALGNLCFAYWVDNHNDLMRLQNLVDRTFTNKSYRPSIIIQPHSVCVCCYNFFV